MAQVIHPDSISKKHTGYYTIPDSITKAHTGYYTLDVGDNWSEFGYLKKGKKEGFWVRSYSFESCVFFELAFYHYNKIKDIGISTSDSSPIR
jgi:hypothetical protein